MDPSLFVFGVLVGPKVFKKNISQKPLLVSNSRETKNWWFFREIPIKILRKTVFFQPAKLKSRFFSGAFRKTGKAGYKWGVNGVKWGPS